MTNKFLGAWKTINNPNFKGVEFATFIIRKEYVQILHILK